MTSRGDKCVAERPSGSGEQLGETASQRLFESAFTEDRVKSNGAADVGSKIDKLMSGLSWMPSGTYSPEKIKTLADTASILGVKIDLPPELDKIDHVTKDGNHFDLALKQPESILIGQDVPYTAGAVRIESLDIAQNSKFDLKVNEDGSYTLSNIEGMKVRSSVAGQDVDVNIKELHIARNKDGELVITPTLENPLGWAATFSGMPENYRPEIVLAKDGTVRIDNKTELAVKTVAGPILTAILPPLILVDPILSQNL
jgi:hypothetical protein